MRYFFLFWELSFCPDQVQQCTGAQNLPGKKHSSTGQTSAFAGNLQHSALFETLAARVPKVHDEAHLSCTSPLQPQLKDTLAPSRMHWSHLVHCQVPSFVTWLGLGSFDSPLQRRKSSQTSWKSSVEVIEVEAEGHKLQNALIASGLSAERKQRPSLHTPSPQEPSCVCVCAWVGR